MSEPEDLLFKFETRHSTDTSYEWESDDKRFSVRIYEHSVNSDVQLDVTATPVWGRPIEVRTRVPNVKDAKRRAAAMIELLRPLFGLAFPEGTLP